MPTKEKIKQEKKPTLKLTKSPKTPTKTPPKDQRDDYVLFYLQSLQKKEYLASLEVQMKEKNKKIGKLEKSNLKLQTKLNLLSTEAAEEWRELKMMKIKLDEKEEKEEQIDPASLITSAHKLTPESKPVRKWVVYVKHVAKFCEWEKV